MFHKAKTVSVIELIWWVGCLLLIGILADIINTTVFDGYLVDFHVLKIIGH
jgi:hypothetical protein